MTSSQKNGSKYVKIEKEKIDSTLLASATTAIDNKLYKVTTKVFDTAVLLFIALAMVFFVFWILNIFIFKKSFGLLYCIMIAIIVFIVGAIYAIKFSTKKNFQNGIVNQYQFYRQYITIISFQNGEKKGSTNIQYRDIIKRKYIAVFQEAGYLVLYYRSLFSPLYIHLKDLSYEELLRLAEIFKIRLRR